MITFIKKHFERILFYALIAAAFYFTLKTALYGQDWRPNAQAEISYLQYSCKTKYIDLRNDAIIEKKKEWKKELDFHKKNGLRCYEDAKEKCWYLPNIPDREKAKYCFSSAMASLGSAIPTGKLALATLSFLMQYGLDCMDEWNYIDNKLHWSQYHYEMAEFYEDLLKNA